MGQDYVSVLLQPLTGYVLSPGDRLNMEPGLNGSDREKPKDSEKNLSQCHFANLKSHMDRPGSEPGTPRWEARDWLTARPEFSPYMSFLCRIVFIERMVYNINPLKPSGNDMYRLL
jgi:hypothetical protein